MIWGEKWAIRNLIIWRRSRPGGNKNAYANKLTPVSQKRLKLLNERSCRFCGETASLDEDLGAVGTHSYAMTGSVYSCWWYQQRNVFGDTSSPCGWDPGPPEHRGGSVFKWWGWVVTQKVGPTGFRTAWSFLEGAVSVGTGFFFTDLVNCLACVTEKENKQKKSTKLQNPLPIIIVHY